MIPFIPRPARSVENDYRIARRHRQRMAAVTLTSLEPVIMGAYCRYEQLGGSPATVKPLQLDIAASKALDSNYPLTYKSRPLNDLRSDLLTGAIHGLCPYCGREQATDLDHFLPKSNYPEFSILAWNLVPVCKTCNDLKRDFESRRGAHFLHPYFLAEITEPILVSKIDDKGGISASFKVNDCLPRRIAHCAQVQFSRLALSEKYSAAAAVELTECAEEFEKAYDWNGRDEVAGDALRKAKYLRSTFGLHYWKAALYEAIGCSDMFCGGGFKRI